MILKILADSGSHQISALKIDQYITDIVIKQFDEQKNRQNKPSLREFPSSVIKILKEANRFKETLSANKQATLFIENILDGEDFKTLITREQLEQFVVEKQEELVKPIEQVLQKANLTINELNSIEILGGGVRVPKIQSIV